MTITGLVKDGVLRLARVPAEPHVPEGAEESVRVFNAGRNYLAWRLILWGLGNGLVALGLAVAFAFSVILPLPPLVRTIWWAVEVGAAGVFAVSVPITYFLQRLNYEMRWYIVTDRSLRIRSGVVWLQEITMTFANIQGIRVNANPIERWLGLANVEVRSAGGGSTDADGPMSSGHVGKLAGVGNAEAIRDLLVERLRVYSDSGLGEKPMAAKEPLALSAAREVLQETRALRNSLAGGLRSNQWGSLSSGCSSGRDEGTPSGACERPA
jgi:membrane protein YdbS with pleckstrin-like domain